MPHVSRLIGLAVLVLVALSLVIVALEAQQPPRNLLLAYGNVSAIGAEGGNVTRLVATLNEAINLTEAGQYDGAEDFSISTSLLTTFSRSGLSLSSIIVTTSLGLQKR